MNLFLKLFTQCVSIILGIVIVFQVGGKIFIKDFKSDFDDDEEE